MATTEVSRAAADIRIALKAEYPGVKFAVRSQVYSGGNSVRVSWIDGPSDKDVDMFLGRFSDGHFDGMTDSYSHAANDAKTPHRAKFVFVERTVSQAIMDRIMDDLNRSTSGMSNSQKEDAVYRMLRETDLSHGYGALAVRDGRFVATPGESYRAS